MHAPCHRILQSLTTESCILWVSLSPTQSLLPSGSLHELIGLSLLVGDSNTGSWGAYACWLASLFLYLAYSFSEVIFLWLLLFDNFSLFSDNNNFFTDNISRWFMHLDEVLKCFDVCLMKQKYNWNLAVDIKVVFTWKTSKLYCAGHFSSSWLRTVNPGVCFLTYGNLGSFKISQTLSFRENRAEVFLFFQKAV